MNNQKYFWYLVLILPILITLTSTSRTCYPFNTCQFHTPYFNETLGATVCGGICENCNQSNPSFCYPCEETNSCHCFPNFTYCNIEKNCSKTTPIWNPDIQNYECLGAVCDDCNPLTFDKCEPCAGSNQTVICECIHVYQVTTGTTGSTGTTGTTGCIPHQNCSGTTPRWNPDLQNFECPGGICEDCNPQTWDKCEPCAGPNDTMICECAHARITTGTTGSTGSTGTTGTTGCTPISIPCTNSTPTFDLDTNRYFCPGGICNDCNPDTRDSCLVCPTGQGGTTLTCECAYIENI